MTMAEQHEQAVQIRVGTRHPVTIEIADGSRRTAHPIIGEGNGLDAYPNLVRVKTNSQDEGEDDGGVGMRSQTMGGVFNLPAVEELADDEIVFVSALVVAALESQGRIWLLGASGINWEEQAKRQRYPGSHSVLEYAALRLGRVFQ